MAKNSLFITSYALYNAGKQFASENSGAWYSIYEDLFEIEGKVKQAQIEFDLGEDVELMATDIDWETIPKGLYSESINSELWAQYQTIDALSETEAIAFDFLHTYRGYSLDDSLAKIEDVNLVEQSPSDCAYDFVQDCYALPEIALSYFDFDRFARDLEMNGDIYDMENGYIVTNANEF